MGDDAIGALEITSVKIQGLRSRIMVPVCSGKAAPADVMGLSEVAESVEILLGTSSSAEARG